jgi:hypothetical protein
MRVVAAFVYSSRPYVCVFICLRVPYAWFLLASAGTDGIHDTTRLSCAHSLLSVGVGVPLSLAFCNFTSPSITPSLHVYGGLLA